jgi:hypothetical protein
MADPSVFSTAGRTPSAQMDADLSTLHAPEAAAEVDQAICLVEVEVDDVVPPPLSEHRFYDPNLVIRQVLRLAHWDFHPSITRVLLGSCRNSLRKATRQK